MFRVLSSFKGLPKEITGEFKELQIDEKGELTREELLGIVNEYDRIIAGFMIQYDYEIFSKAKKLKVITRFGIGVENVNISDAEKCNVKVTNVPGVSAESVAEHTLCLMLAASRNLATLDRKIKANEWPRAEGFGHELANKTLGQIGF